MLSRTGSPLGAANKQSYCKPYTQLIFLVYHNSKLSCLAAK